MKGLSSLSSWLRRHCDKVAVAFSGGVDSTLLAYVANTVLDEVLAVTVRTEVHHPWEIEDAKRVARRIGFRHEVLSLKLLNEKNFVKNDSLRCYYCKKLMMKKVKEYVGDKGFEVIVDGTNADDMRLERPGIRALKEEGVLSPLAELGFTKVDIRKLAQSLGLPNWNKAPETCLATRIPEGTKITLKRLKRILKAEATVKEVMQLKLLRVRDLGDVAKIEVLKEDFDKFANVSLVEEVVSRLKALGFKHVFLDLSGYRGYTSLPIY